MDEVVASAQWTVSTRSSGEVLAVWTGDAGLRVGFLGASPGVREADVRRWLADLVHVIAETAREPADEAAARPVPALLHHALSGLLFYEAELWSRGERPPCAVVLTESEGRVAIGWCGSGRIELMVAGRAFEPRWTLIRDDAGHLARACLLDDRDPIGLAVAWHVADGTAVEAGVLEAHWPGASPLPAPVEERAEAAPAPAVAETGDRADAGSRRQRLWRFRSWMDRLAGPRPRRAPEEAAAEPIVHDVPGVPDVIAPTEPVSSDPASTAAEPGRAAEDAATGISERSIDPYDLGSAFLTESDLTVETVLSAPIEAAAPAHEPEASFFGDLEPPIEEAGDIEPLMIAERRVEEFAAAAPAPGEVRRPATPHEAPATIAGPPGAARGLPAAGSRESLEAPPTRVPATGPSAIEETIEAAPGAPALEGAVEPSPTAPALAQASSEARSEPPAGAAPFQDPEPVAAPEVAAPEVAAKRRPRVRRPEWPAPEESAAAPRALWKRPWLAAGVVLALFASGWLLGRVEPPSGARGLGAALQAIGFGPSRYEVAVTSDPSGAWIGVDGRDQALRTPATLQLAPGPHRVVLTLSGLGGSAHDVDGKRGERVALAVQLWGTLSVRVPEGSVPTEVAVDGMPRGYAPVRVDRLSPGIHRLQFSGPGLAPWEQTVEVHVDRTAEVVAVPIASPPTGVLEVRATLADETGTEPLAGAAIWIDGERRGLTPLRLELPRGPHSVRASWGDEQAPVDVVELPGGNERFVTLEFGTATEQPRLDASLPGPVPLDRPVVVSASLDRAHEGDVREMWLHVRTPEGAWRRYPMDVMKAAGGLAGVAVFPVVLFDAQGRTSWYVSVLTPMGDEYFTEIQAAQAAVGQ